MSARAIAPGERFDGARCSIRLCTLDDVSPRYVAWLEDPEVNRYLETRFSPQTLDSVAAFVTSQLEHPASYLFAICAADGGAHVGNVKVGPVNPHHGFADVSYFLGERSAWGKGIGTEAVRLATRFGFERLGLHRLQAGLYAGNVGSRRVLEKAGYVLEASLRKQLRSDAGWEDHLYFGALAGEWS